MSLEKIKDSFDRIFIDERSGGSRLAARALKIFSPSQIQWVTTKPLAEREGRLTPSEFSESKRNLYISPFEGNFFKRCPGAKPGLSCCNYFVLNLGLQCNFNCSYCYLQNYINTPTLNLYSNVEQAVAELEAVASERPDLFYRVGTGEVTDSLSLDPFTLYSRDLIDFFRRYPKWTLELKTKSDYVDQFLDLPHAGNVVVSWSINPEFLVATEEHGTASLANRLQAARKCADRGYKVAFHLDPMIWFPDWKAHYLGLAQEVKSRFSPSEVDWISFGALRYQPEQRRFMRARFGMNTWVNRAETFLSRDGKMRYDLETRNEMFKTLRGAFTDHSPDWRVALCMETKEAWAGTMSSTPRQMPEIEELFRPLPKIGAPQIKGAQTQNESV